MIAPRDDPSLGLAGEGCWRRIGVWSRERPSCVRLPGYGHCLRCPELQAGGRAFFERPHPAGYLAELADRRAAREKPATCETHHALEVMIEGVALGLDLRSLRCVAPLKPVHRVPHRGRGLGRGVVTARGALMPCASLARALGLPADAPVPPHQPIGKDGRLVVLVAGAVGVAVAVSKVLGIRRFAAQALAPAPATFAESDRALLLGALETERGVLLVLDGPALARRLEEGLSR